MLLLSIGMLAVYLMLLGLLAMGCSPSGRLAEVRQEAAEKTWQYLGAKSELPNIQWVDTLEYDGKSYLGLYFDDGDALVLDVGGPPSQSALVHELYHAYQWLERGINDPHHQLIGWQTDVPDAYAYLAAEGY